MTPKQNPGEPRSLGAFTNALNLGRGRFTEWLHLSPQSLTPLAMPLAWTDREDREISVEEHVRQGIAWQIRVNREERGLNQVELAKLMRTGQSAISKLEDPDGGDVRISTLIKAAHAFDCALLVKFVPFSEFAQATSDVRSERLFACAYSAEQSPRTKVVAPYQSHLSSNEHAEP